ncbi:hypothetical protein AFLA_000096 [Aspergillus flavus NRRL3357]|nr:hypothetical protein AFLA_000096 [Aspergillus flavus NRRL3357]
MIRDLPCVGSRESPAVYLSFGLSLSKTRKFATRSDPLCLQCPPNMPMASHPSANARLEAIEAYVRSILYMIATHACCSAEDIAGISNGTSLA